MQKIAVPVDNNRLYLQFESSPYFQIYTIEKQKVKIKDLMMSQLNSKVLPFWLAKKGVTDIIAYTIDRELIKSFNQFKINVFVGVKISDPLKLITEFVQGTLETEDVLT